MNVEGGKSAGSVHVRAVIPRDEEDFSFTEVEVMRSCLRRDA